MQEYISKLYDSLVEASNDCKSNYLSFSGGLDSTIIAYLLKEKIHGVEFCRMWVDFLLLNNDNSSSNLFLQNLFVQ